MTTTRAAIYCRISSDPRGQRAGVERQRADCLALVARQGWQTVQVYEDNDQSAYSGKARAAFERLLTDTAAGLLDVLVVWTSDRLYRRMRDLTRIADELAPHVRIVAVKESEIDLTTAEGVLRAQVMGSVAEFESARKGERVAARAKQRATVDGRMTASRRPFGWRWADPCPGGNLCQHKAQCASGQRPRAGSRAGLLVDEAEAPAVVAVFDLMADGGSVRAAARLLTSLGHKGSAGRPFTPETARVVLTNPRHGGLVAHNGAVVADATDGLAIIPAEQWRLVQARLSDPARRTTPGRPAGTPLSGLAVCGRCGGPMNATNKHRPNGRVPVYTCSRHAHLTRRRDLVDAPVLALVGAWLAANASTIATQAAPGPGGRELAAAREVNALTQRLAALHDLVAAGDLDPVDYAQSARAVRGRLRDAQARAVVAAGRPATARLLAAGDIKRAWRELVDATDVEPLRQVLREVVEVKINTPAIAGHPTRDDLVVRLAGWTDA